jgi:thiamine biosynthesis lipoprotein
MIKTYLLFLFTLFFLMSCKPSAELKVVQGNALGTTYAVSIFEEELKGNDVTLRKAFDSLFFEVNASMSTYQSDSSISRINAGDTAVVVDALFEEVFRLSERIYKESKGYFDPTVGVLVSAWGFGPKELSLEKPSNLDSLLERVGLDKVSMVNRKIRMKHPGIQFDFNAVAKGYTLDKMSEVLDELGAENYLVELGGEIFARGINKQKNSAWKIGIDDPKSPESTKVNTIVGLSDQAMATSGNYRKFRIDSISKKKYVHTINPISGMAEPTNVLSASVIAPTCAEADAYATALMAMPLELSKAFLKERPDFSAFILYVDEYNQTHRISQGHFGKTSVE